MNSLVQLTIDAHGGFERWRRFEHRVSTPSDRGHPLGPEAPARRSRRCQCARRSKQRVDVALAVPETQPADIVRTSPCGHRNDGRTRRRRAPPTSRLVRGSSSRYTVGSVAARVLRRLRNVDLPDDTVPLCGGWRHDGRTRTVPENGEVWRRLKVTFPHNIATHSTVQIVLCRLGRSTPAP